MTAAKLDHEILDREIKAQRERIAALAPRYAEQQQKFLAAAVRQLNAWY